ncbi:MAG: xanthine dehydrogenase family protein subunit M [Chromatiales bacterium]|jgi:xanthine dehydrogenase YagS FAD-binding subunit
MLPAFAYIRPAHLQDAVARLAEGGAEVHAGGTDLLGCLRDEVYTVDTLVSLSAVQGLSGVRETGDGGLVIGAMTRIADVAANPRIRAAYAGLAQAAAEVGSPQLRSQGTLGGNLCQKPRCWYYRGDFHCLRKGGYKCFAVTGENEYHCILGGANCFIVHPSDTAPALVSLDAEVKIAGPDGGRRLPVADLHVPPAENPRRETRLEPGEVIVEVILPGPAAGLRSSYRKVRTRRSWDFAVAGCALALAMDGDQVRDCRVVLSGAAPVPWRSKEAEEALRGRSLDDATIRAAAKAAVAEARPMSNNAYKVPLFEGMLEEELRKAADAA